MEVMKSDRVGTSFSNRGASKWGKTGGPAYEAAKINEISLIWTIVAGAMKIWKLDMEYVAKCNEAGRTLRGNIRRRQREGKKHPEMKKNEGQSESICFQKEKYNTCQ